MRLTYCLTFLFIALTASLAPAAEPRPNLMIIIADDLNWRDLGFTGNAEVHTPNLDRLAREGMQLEGMFTPAPTCSPCRHALYTGLFPIRSGAYPNHTMVDRTTKSLFTHLKANGYRVGLQGKTHISPPASFPYENIGGNADDSAAFAKCITRDAEQPWFAVFASHDPHSPWNRGPRERYEPAKLTVPPWLHDNAETRADLAAYYAEITQLDTQVGERLAAIEKAGQTENTLVLFLSEQGSSFPYGGKWSLYDTGIRVASIARWPAKIAAGSKSGALVQYVDVAPTFLAAAGVDPAKIDTGCPDADGKSGFDGQSFLEVLTGKADSLREYVFAQHTTVGVNGYKEPYPSRAVRDGRYKLIRNLAPENRFWIGGIHGSAVLRTWERDAADDPKLAERIAWLERRPAEELYDLETDPLEQHNLAGRSEFAEIQTRLGKELDAWMRQQGDEGLATEIRAKTRQPRARRAERG